MSQVPFSKDKSWRFGWDLNPYSSIIGLNVPVVSSKGMDGATVNCMNKLTAYNVHVARVPQMDSEEPAGDDSLIFDLVEETSHLVSSVEAEATIRIDRWHSLWTSYFQIFYSQFDSICSMLLLLKKAKYRDCFVLLRTAFEHYFLLLLMVKGTRYRDTRTFQIISEGTFNVREARDKTLEKWRNDWKAGKLAYREFIAIDPGHDDDVIHVTYETEGLFQTGDVDKKGEAIPKFYFAFEQYDPDIHYLADLPTLDTRGPPYRDLVKEHKHLYSQFLNIERISKNLELNSLLNSEQRDRFRVHYNFLSSFAHPTSRGVQYSNSFQYTLGETGRKDPILEKVVLGYIAHFQAMMIELTVGYFTKKNPNADMSIYARQAEKLKQAAADFWFIYNDPTSFDVKESDVRKEWMKVQGFQIPSSVLYYADPIDRVRKITRNQ